MEEDAYQQCIERMIGIDYLGKSAGPVESVPPSLTLTLSDSACVRPNPDSLYTIWKKPPEFCKDSSFVPHPGYEAHSEAQYPMPSAQRDDPRIWTPDLSAEIEKRQRLSGEIWDPYKHMKARQNMASFFNAGILKRRDKWGRTVPLASVLGIEQGQLSKLEKERQAALDIVERRLSEEKEARRALADYQQCVFRY
jgi:hypothetical protein